MPLFLIGPELLRVNIRHTFEFISISGTVICPYQLENKCSKETILNIWKYEKYFSVLHIYQLFGYN